MSCALLSFCRSGYPNVLEKEFSVVRLQPGGIRRKFDKPPPRQLITQISSGAINFLIMLKLPSLLSHYKAELSYNRIQF